MTEIAHGCADSGFGREVAHMNDLPVKNRRQVMEPRVGTIGNSRS